MLREEQRQFVSLTRPSEFYKFIVSQLVRGPLTLQLVAIAITVISYHSNSNNKSYFLKDISFCVGFLKIYFLLFKFQYN